MLFMAILARGTIAMPSISLGYAPQPKYNEANIALLVENRAQPLLVPLLLQFMYALPPDWRFRFMGSEASVAAVNRSAAVREHVRAGKLDLTYIPSNMSTAGQEMISRFLTTLWIYETALQPAEFLLVFQTDSMMCANSKHNLDDYLGYHWVGAPWNPSGNWGGNGGLSLRRVSRIVDVLRKQRRQDNSDPEDVWLSERIGHHSKGKVANGSVALTFSGEMNSGEPEQVSKTSSSEADDGDCGGIAVPSSGQPGDLVRGLDDLERRLLRTFGIPHRGIGGMDAWRDLGTRNKREHIWQYCPEVTMILHMDMAAYVPDNCNENW